jgi:hypothetical protein
MFSITIHTPIGREVTIPGFCAFVIPATLSPLDDSVYNLVTGYLNYRGITDYTVTGYNPPYFPPQPPAVLPDGLVDRGMVSVPDFTDIGSGGTLIPDVVPHLLSLASIVPSNARFAHLEVILTAGTGPVIIYFLNTEAVTPLNAFVIMTEPPALAAFQCGFVKLDSSLQVGYAYVDMGRGSTVAVSVRGWLA